MIGIRNMGLERRACLAALALVACACAPPKGGVQRGPRGTREPSGQQAPSKLQAPPEAPPEPRGPSARDKELERLIAERDRLRDPGLTFSRFPQTAPPRPYSIPPRGAFPDRARVARAVLYTFGRSRVPGCTAVNRLPFTSAGTLCPDVVAPGVELDADELRRAFDLVPAAIIAHQGRSAKRPVLRCEFDPHHAVAFFDAAGSVVAKMLVCFSCGEWIVAPTTEALGGVEPSMMSENEHATLAKLFDAHGLAAWAFSGALAEEVGRYELATYGTEDEPTQAGLARRARRLAPGSGAPKSTAIRDLSREERQALCDWAAHEARPAGREARNSGYECEDGRSWSTAANEPECATSKSTCGHTVGEVEACLRVFREPDHFCVAPPAPCLGVLECLPGVRLRGTR